MPVPDLLPCQPNSLTRSEWTFGFETTGAEDAFCTVTVDALRAQQGAILSGLPRNTGYEPTPSPIPANASLFFLAEIIADVEQEFD
eukprot:272724-Prymnesium_polylepis.2